MIKTFYKLIFFLVSLSFSLGLFGNDPLGPKEEYKLVVSEIIQILDQNHFKKNIEISNQKVIDNFLNTLDKEKIVFTANEYDSYSSNFRSIFDLKEIFMIYEDFSKRSIELINHQMKVVNNLESLEELNTTDFIDKTRENETRFESLADIKIYHALLIKNEFINIILSSEEFMSSKSKLLKRLKNRLKSLKRVKSDDIFSIFANAITSLYDPHTNYLSPKSQEDFEINTRFGKFRLRAYKQTTNNNVHIALTKGSWDKGDAVLTRINSKSVQNDILGILTTDTDASLSKMFEIINNDEMGAMIFISPELKAINTLKRLKILKKNQAKNKVTKAPILNMDDRDFGIGAQILHDLDITNLKLITNTKETRRVGMIGYGLEISEYINF